MLTDQERESRNGRTHMWTLGLQPDAIAEQWGKGGLFNKR